MLFVSWIYSWSVKRKLAHDYIARINTSAILPSFIFALFLKLLPRSVSLSVFCMYSYMLSTQDFIICCCCSLHTQSSAFLSPIYPLFQISSLVALCLAVYAKLRVIIEFCIQTRVDSPSWKDRHVLNYDFTLRPYATLWSCSQDDNKKACIYTHV